jgi:hypothetical protein
MRVCISSRKFHDYKMVKTSTPSHIIIIKICIQAMACPSILQLEMFVHETQRKCLIIGQI